jgi:DNA-binding NtrC family response regulator
VARLMRVPALIAELGDEPETADNIVGRGAAMHAVYKSIGRVAPQNATVLILGESGTGKELVARAIYQYSRRNNGPFLAINCSAIPETFLENDTGDLYARWQNVTELHLLQRILEHAKRNLSQAAKILGIHRATLRSKIAALGLDADEGKNRSDDRP